MQGQAIIFRDGEGNFYLVSGATLDEGKVPADKVAALQQALGGEVSGYGAFFSPDFSSQFASLASNQQNFNTGTQVAGIAVGGNILQGLTQTGVNIGGGQTSGQGTVQH